MLNTAEIIELYDKKEYNAIANKLDLSHSNANPRAILLRTISIENIELIIHIFSIDSASEKSINLIFNKPHLYPTLELILANNIILCEKIIEYFPYIWQDIKITEFDNIRLLNIIMTYLNSTAIIDMMTHMAIELNYLNMLDIIFEHGYSISSGFNRMMSDFSPYCQYQVKCNTFIHLQQYNVNIFEKINIIGAIFFIANNVTDLIFCLENGADINFMLKCLNTDVKVDTLNCLLDYGADFNNIRSSKIQLFIRDYNLDIIRYLVDNGLNLDNYFNKLLLYAVTTNSSNILEYFITLGADIHFDNDLLLLYACKCNRINIVELLLQYEFDDNSFLLFIETDLSSYRLIYGINVRYDFSNYFLIANKLIQKGFTIDNPTHAFCAYVKYTSYCIIEENVFIYFLEQGIDFNFQDAYGRYVLESVVSNTYDSELIKLCLQYGADPYINNHGPLQIAVECNKLKSARLLLELNSTLTSEPECSITLEMINLLKEFNMEID